MEFRVQGLGFRVWGLGFRLGFRVNLRPSTLNPKPQTLILIKVLEAGLEPVISSLGGRRLIH